MNFIITLDNLKYIELAYGSPIKKQRVIRPKSKVPIYRLLEPITAELSDGELITIPKGFEWDLASVPRRLWSFLAPDGDFDFGTIIHDYLYQTEIRSRKFADQEMLKWNLAVSNDDPEYRDQLYLRYQGVRLFGGIAKFIWKITRRGK